MKNALHFGSGYLEAVAILSSWAARAGAVEVVPQNAGDGKRLIARNAQREPVGACTWKRGCAKLHVVVGFGSWQVSPVVAVDVDRLDKDTATAARYGYYREVVPTVFPTDKENGQTALALGA